MTTKTNQIKFPLREFLQISKRYFLQILMPNDKQYKRGGKTYGHIQDLIMLAGHLVGNNANLNCVKADPEHVMKAY